MTLGECKALLAIVGRNYDRAIPVGLAEDWQRALADIPQEVGLKALQAHIAESRYFPTVADIRAKADVVKPRPLYLMPSLPEPVPQEEICGLVEQVLAKLKGGQ